MWFGFCRVFGTSLGNFLLLDNAIHATPSFPLSPSAIVAANILSSYRKKKEKKKTQLEDVAFAACSASSLLEAIRAAQAGCVMAPWRSCVGCVEPCELFSRRMRVEVRRPRRERRVAGVVCLNWVNSLIRPHQFFSVLS